MEGLTKTEITGDRYRINKDNVGMAACKICQKEDLECFGPKSVACLAEEIKSKQKQFEEELANSNY